MAKRATPRRAGRPRASERSPAETRHALLDAAAQVFAAQGYRNATVDAVVAESGLSKGSFYWHFDSKEELFAELLEDRIDRPARAVMEVTRTAPAESATAATVSKELAALFAAERELILLMHEYWSAAVRDRRLRNRYVARQKDRRAALASALAARHERTGVPLTMPAQDLATAIIALTEGLAMEAVVEPNAFGPDLLGEILSLLYDGLAARSPAAAGKGVERKSGKAAERPPSRRPR
jgi:AcrR family transcriptional regulator